MRQGSRTRYLAMLALAAMILPVTLHAAPAGFVQRRHGEFVLGGQPFFVAGVNNHYLTFGSAREVTAVLDDAVAMGANVVRTFIQPVIGSPDGAGATTIWNWRSTASSADLGVHGAYMLHFDRERGRMAINIGPDGLQKLDFLVSEARKRNLRLIIAFLDFWSFTGGARQISAWYGGDGDPNFFFRDARTSADYRQLVRSVLERVNPLTGIAYRDEPAIFAWELMNEPDDVRPVALRRAWIAGMAAYVKSIDPNHMVASGLANVAARLADIDLPDIDFAVWHGYPLYYKLSVAAFDRLIVDFCAIGAAHDKPVLLEEFGYARGNADQVAAYRQWLATLARQPNCPGWLVWRLVSRQGDGRYPADTHDQFDVHNDGSALWQVLSDAAGNATRRPISP